MEATGEGFPHSGALVLSQPLEGGGEVSAEPAAACEQQHGLEEGRERRGG